MVKKSEALEIMGLLNQVYLTNDLLNWADWLSYFCVLMWWNGFWFDLQSAV